MNDSEITMQSRTEPNPFLCLVAVSALMTFRGAAFTAIAAFFAIAPAQAHWCNSGGRLTNIEQAICSDGSLINKDIELNRLYSTLGGSRNPGLKAGQRSWMNGRNRCTSMDCLHAYYDQRLRALRVMARGPSPSAPPAPTYTPQHAPPPPPPAASAPSAPGSGSLQQLPEIKPF